MKEIVRILAAFGLLAGLVFGSGVGAQQVKTAANGIVSITIGASNVAYGSFLDTLSVDCGDPTFTCQAFVGRNGIFPQTLFATVHGTLTNAPINFIADGCYNFSVYADTSHTSFEVAVNAGHGDLIAGFACTNATPGGASFGRPTLGVSPTTISDPSTTALVEWDSGFTDNVEDAQGWIWKNSAASPLPLVNGVPTCPTTPASYPNASEVLYSQYPNKAANDLKLIGGGPYCISLYEGAGHTKVLSTTVQVTTQAYLLTAPNNTIAYNTGDSAMNGAVCIFGAAGGTAASPLLYTFNSQGYSNVARLPGVNTYLLLKGVTVDPQAPNSSCLTGTLLKSGNATG